MVATFLNQPLLWQLGPDHPMIWFTKSNKYLPTYRRAYLKQELSWTQQGKKPQSAFGRLISPKIG